MYSNHACCTCHNSVQWQLLCYLGIEIENVALNHSIHIYLSMCNNFNSITMPSFSPNLLLLNLMDAILGSFYFMIAELRGVGYSWRSLLNWLHYCPSCLSWKLWGTILAPNTRLLVYISSQWGRVPLFLQHSNREICSLKLHMYVVQPLYPYSQWRYASYHTPVWIHWNFWNALASLSGFPY